jgi:heptosyltransferase III
VETGFLVIHPGALGDVLQAVPALRGLRAVTPAAPITFVGQPRLARLLVELGAAQRARPFDGFGLEALFGDAPTPSALADAVGRMPYVVSWFGSRDETYRRRLRALAVRAIVAPPVPDDDTPVWRHLLGTLAGWGLAIPERVEPLPAPALAAGDAPADARRPRLVVHPGSGGDWKRWPVERFAEVIRGVRERRTLDVLVHQGPADAEPAQRLLARLEGDAAVLREPDLPRLAAVLGAAAAYLGGDTGVSHLAAAVGAPAVMLFPAATLAAWAPWSRTARVVSMDPRAGAAERAAAALAEAISASPRSCP